MPINLAASFNMKMDSIFMRLNSNYILGSSYAYDSINFKVDKFLDTNTLEGKWFAEFTKNLNRLNIKSNQRV